MVIPKGGRMKAICNLAGGLLVAAAALGTGAPQSTTQDLRLSDIRAQQPKETIFASELCQRAREDSQGWVIKTHAIDPKTLVQDLNTLMERSDEVILAGMLDYAVVPSPSGERPATYSEVKIVRSWKGPHRAGDVLTYGVPFGSLPCEQSPPSSPTPRFDFVPADFGVTASPPYAYLLFLRQSKGNETQLVQGLRLAAGEGVQGIFMIQVPAPLPTDTERYCNGSRKWNVGHCNSYVETSQSPVLFPYAHDPLAKRYGGMSASDFLREVRSVATAEGLKEMSSSK
jgi:hypothetical protein